MPKQIERERRFAVKPKGCLLEKLSKKEPIYVNVYAALMGTYCIYKKTQDGVVTWWLRRKTGTGLVREEEEHEISEGLAKELIWDDIYAKMTFECWALSENTCLKRMKMTDEDGDDYFLYIYEEETERSDHTDFYLDPYITVFGEREKSDDIFLMADDVTDCQFDVRTIAIHNHFRFYKIEK